MKLKMWLIPAALVGMMLWPFSVKAEEDTIHFSLNIDELTDENGYLQADDDAGDSTGLKYSVSMTGDSLSKTSFTDNGNDIFVNDDAGTITFTLLDGQDSSNENWFDLENIKIRGGKTPDFIAVSDGYTWLNDYYLDNYAWYERCYMWADSGDHLYFNLSEEYMEMGNANFNLVLYPESNYAAQDLNQRLGMPYIEFPRLYEVERIHRLYQLFAKAIGVVMDDTSYYLETKQIVQEARSIFQGKKLVIGEMLDANPFELACALSELGFEIMEIFSNVTQNDKKTIQRLAKVSPNTQVYTGISPSMVHYQARQDIDLTIGKDAGMLYPDVPCVPWNQEEQPFGYQGLQDLIAEMRNCL